MFHSHLNVLKVLFCVFLEGGWKWEVCYCIVFWLNPWFANFFFSRWPCCINLKKFCEKRMSLIISLRFGVRFLPLPFSTIKSQNLLNWLKLQHSKCLVSLRMNAHLIRLISWKINYSTNLTQIWTFAPNSTTNIFSLCKIFLMNTPWPMAWQTMLLC